MDLKLLTKLMLHAPHKVGMMMIKYNKKVILIIFVTNINIKGEEFLF